MLHEIMLSLSGHPSVLFGAGAASQPMAVSSEGLLSPPEDELLSSVRELSRLHQRTRDHASTIVATHPSTICRAVASSITSHHLEAFQQKIIGLETRFLCKDSGAVGAQSIVPLASIVSEFSDWTRLMNWLWELNDFMLPLAITPNDGVQDRYSCSGAQVIDKLRSEVQTGYPEIEVAASHLGQVAETAWLRQLSPWLLHGRLPSFGQTDFLIQRADNDPDEKDFRVHHPLLPKFVTRQTASSILFIGTSLQQSRSMRSLVTQPTPITTDAKLDMGSIHARMLSRLATPVTTSEFSEAVNNIRISLSRNLLQFLLPREKIIETMSILNQFFLLGRGEFAISLITQADTYMSSHTRAAASSKHAQEPRPHMLKNSETSQILGRCFSALSALIGDEQHTDDILEAASQVLHLRLQNSQLSRPATPGRAKESGFVLPEIFKASFDELLLSVPVSLIMETDLLHDLFLTKSDMNVYSALNSYLLAIRRAHIHLSQLWQQSPIRREHPSPPAYMHSNSPYGKLILSRGRQRSAERARAMRPLWATCKSSLFFLAEIGAYFHGDVIQPSFQQFFAWLNNVSEGTTTLATHPYNSLSGTGNQNSTFMESKNQYYDPETLAQAHRRLIASVSYGLLITDPVFSKTLHAFCMHVDYLVAYVVQLINVQRNLDLEEDEGINSASQNYREEERRIKSELDRARRRLDSDLKDSIERLRELDNERLGIPIPYHTFEGQNILFELPKVDSINRLLMKLD